MAFAALIYAVFGGRGRAGILPPLYGARIQVWATHGRGADWHFDSAHSNNLTQSWRIDLQDRSLRGKLNPNSV